VTITPIPDMPTDFADHLAPPEGAAPPDSGTPSQATGEGAPVPAPVEPGGVPSERESHPEPETLAPDQVTGQTDGPAQPEALAPDEVTGPADGPAEPAAPETPDAAPSAAAPATRQGPGGRGPAREAAGGRPSRRPARGVPRGRGDGPAVPMPEHHHLPGWVRRAHAKARPELAELLGSLQGPHRGQFLARLEELVAAISSGKFSVAWQYPDVIAEGRAILERQRSDLAEAAKATRHLESARRRAADRLRDAAELLTADAASRLQRALRSASDGEAIAAVEAEANKALSTARSAHNKRRDREIERTRARIHRTLPRAALEAESPTETWQDVLRRFAEEQSASTGAGG
jgi:hypothetical protein